MSASFSPKLIQTAFPFDLTWALLPNSGIWHSNNRGFGALCFRDKCESFIKYWARIGCSKLLQEQKAERVGCQLSGPLCEGQSGRRCNSNCDEERRGIRELWIIGVGGADWYEFIYENA